MMLSYSSSIDENRPTESLSQLRVQICSVRLPSSNKSVDISVHMEVDDKYSFRTEIIRRKNRTISTSMIPINESFDVLVTSNSKIKIKILAPTRLFSTHDIGQLQFTIKSILESYHQSLSSEQINTNNNTIPSYPIKLPFENSTTTSSSSTFRSNDVNNNSHGAIEIIFYGSLLKQQNSQQTVRKKRFLIFSFLFTFHFRRTIQIVEQSSTNENNHTTIETNSTMTHSTETTEETEITTAAAVATTVTSEQANDENLAKLKAQVRLFFSQLDLLERN